MIRFLWPWLLLLWPLPALARRWLPPAPPALAGALRVPFFRQLKDLSRRPATPLRPRLHPLLAWFAWSLLLLAAAQPLWLGNFQDRATSGRDLMLLVDVSGSMREMDFKLQGEAIDRLSMVKTLAADFIRRRVGDRLGLILFGAQPYLRAPLSYDRHTVRELLDEAEIALAGEQTAIGDAIGLALKRMRRLESDSRVVLLLTDGANNQGRIGPRQAAATARALGVRIYAVDLGRQTTAAPNPYGPWSAAGAERFGQEMLQEIAATTGGAYFHVLDTAGLADAYAQLDRLEPTLGSSAREYLATPLYPWPLAAALLLFGLLLTKPRLGRWMRRRE